MLRQIEWAVKNRPTTKKTVLRLTTLVFSKFNLGAKTSYK